MTLRRRLALLSALAVAVTVVIASVLVYALVRSQLRGNIDDELSGQAGDIVTRAERGPAFEGGPPPGIEQPPETIPLPPPRPGGAVPVGQLITAEGTAAARPPDSPELPVSAAARELAIEGGDSLFEDAEVDGDSVRVLTEPLPEGGAIQLARSLEDTEETLDTLVLVLVLVSLGGIAAAAALGPVVARAALAPAAEVSSAAEEVARTRDLTRRIEERGDDELGRLASSFNQMMAALERSEAAQRRLVADASHELRTPLATLRTNIETLGRSPGLDATERERLVEDLTAELEEMTDLVADVVELAREPGADGLARQDVRLDELAADAVERARRRHRGLRFDTRLSSSLVNADADRLGRAISNLLDNAAKWSPEEGEVVVEVSDGRVAVRDRGPGFGAEDLPRVFDRFWRADNARGKPGSGLGLAIVQRVAEEHGGAASAANAEGGGALVAIQLPEQAQEAS